ncbi:putative phosphorylase b kinase regulatory subunit beta [Thelohanellus kitauei]|uniref:Phosphorylase b kinase regulatory subunit n=1 Tax=Thelohanellus kitauei TaxID=669202 RepID=A0A0C2N152_THEKT|nr:putative phosphorylase b kinase regulatory subunit beta [Thelohanellus kitauei]
MELYEFDKIVKKQHSIKERPKLEKYYNYIKKTIMSHQSAQLGLFRHLNYVDYGHVRDNVYCALCLWSASLAFRYIDDLSGKTYELEHSAIKCMRGLLYCWMQQSSKVTFFRALVGAIQSDIRPPIKFGHAVQHLRRFLLSKRLQSFASILIFQKIDSVSLYILILCQMTASGSCVYFYSIS